jgi:integrase
MTFKPADTPYWQTDFYNENGERVRVSTKKTTKKEADKVEAELMAKAERRRLGLEVRDVNPKRWTMKEGAAWWLETIAAEGANNGIAYVIAKHVDRDAIAALPLDEVDTGVVSTWLRRRAKGGLSPSSVNHLRAYLMGIFTSLAENGLYAGENPVKATKKAKEPEPEGQTLPATYALPLIEHAPSLGWRVAIATAAYTGMRRDEIRRTFAAPGWPAVDLDERIIGITKTKTGKRRQVAIHVELVAILRDARERHVVMPTAGAFLGSEMIVRHALRRAGIIADVEKCEATFHGLRGMWNTRMEDCDAKESVIDFMWGGKSTTSVRRRHYRKFTPEVLRHEIDKLSWPKGEK